MEARDDGSIEEGVEDSAEGKNDGAEADDREEADDGEEAGEGEEKGDDGVEAEISRRRMKE